MNEKLARKLSKRHKAQARNIRATGVFARVKREFNIEYEVAQEVAKARRAAGLTQQELATAMGTTQSVISRIERGANISIETLDRYVAACGHQLKIQVV
jgi:ribosome-binding protein aMBF1 (putative translation factor)